MSRQKARKSADYGETDPGAGDARKTRINQVDLLKGLAVISVILIHLFPAYLLSMTGAPFYYWQAVPVFLLLAAFTGSLAYKSHQRKNLADLYDPAVLIRRYKRVLAPYLAIWTLQVCLVLVFLPALFLPDAFSSLSSGIMSLLVCFFTGGFGPGNYFIPVILQQILLLPLLYWIAIRFSPDWMLLFALVINIALEACAVVTGLSPDIYTNSFIPYFMAAACGVWLAFHKKEITPWMVAAGLASVVYIAAVYYFNFHFVFIDTAKGFFNVFSYFWTLLLVAAGLRYLSPKSVTLPSRILRELGKASWHIFLVQMTFLLFFQTLMVNAIDKAFPSTGPVSEFIFLSILTIPSLIVCLLFGYGFYLAEENIKARLAGKYPGSH